MLPLTVLALSLLLLTATADEKKAKQLKPCTIRSPSTNAFFDLNQIHIAPPKTSHTRRIIGDKAKEEPVESWHARGYDYGANFTLNFCGPVIEELDDVEGLKKAWQRESVGAYYVKDRKTYSIGSNNSELVFRGRKLVLNFTDGSPCPAPRGTPDDAPPRHKSSLISLLCERDPLAPKAAISFVGSIDDCSYFFEVRTSAACGGVEVSHGESVRLGGVFIGIGIVAVAVYLIGGCVYQRTVMHQRGWRQLPNYSMWSGIYSFVRDISVILLSSCSRFVPSRRGYNRLNQNHYSNPRGRGRDSDDENRLIDQLDEEWED